MCVCGPCSSVGIATDYGLSYGLDGSGSNPGGGRDFPRAQTGPGAHPASCKTGTGSFPGVKCGRGVLLTTHPLLVPRSWKSRAIPLPTLWATPGLQRDHFTFLPTETFCIPVSKGKVNHMHGVKQELHKLLSPPVPMFASSHRTFSYKLRLLELIRVPNKHNKRKLEESVTRSVSPPPQTCPKTKKTLTLSVVVCAWSSTDCEK